VGIVKGAPNRKIAEAFVNYLLSDEGQLFFFSKEIGRLPVVPELYARAPKDYPNPFTMKLGGVDLDDKLSSARRNVVNVLYNQLITFRHAELKAADKAINKAFKEKAELKSRLETEWDTFAKANHAKARGLAEQAAAML